MKTQNLSPGEWEQSSPDNKLMMKLQSKYKFFKDGTVHFELLSPNNLVIERIIYKREDKTNRQNRG